VPEHLGKEAELNLKTNHHDTGCPLARSGAGTPEVFGEVVALPPVEGCVGAVPVLLAG